MEVVDALPYFPDTLPVDQRFCYWNVKLSTEQSDVVITSLHSWCALCRQIIESYDDDCKKLKELLSYNLKDNHNDSHRKDLQTGLQLDVLKHLQTPSLATSVNTALPRLHCTCTARLSDCTALHCTALFAFPHVMVL